jgi:hypothetical protein
VKNVFNFARVGLKEEPFVVSMREAAAKAPKIKLSVAEQKAVAASRKARAKGVEGLSVGEAMKVIRGG